MPFGRHTSLAARGVGPYHDRGLVIENVGDHEATGITVTFTGQQGVVELLDERVDSLRPGEAVRMPLRPVRRGAAFKVTVRWQVEGGEPGQFFGVVTAGGGGHTEHQRTLPNIRR